MSARRTNPQGQERAAVNEQERHEPLSISVEDKSQSSASLPESDDRIEPADSAEMEEGHSADLDADSSFSPPSPSLAREQRPMRPRYGGFRQINPMEQEARAMAAADAAGRMAEESVAQAAGSYRDINQDMSDPDAPSEGEAT